MTTTQLEKLPDLVAQEEQEAVTRFESNQTFTEAARALATAYVLRLKIIDTLDQRQRSERSDRKKYTDEYPHSINSRLITNLLRGGFNSTIGRIFRKTI